MLTRLLVAAATVGAWVFMLWTAADWSARHFPNP
jgi:hypothetical protein